MGLRGELYTTQITVENRTYFFNVKENRTGDVFLQVVESKSTDGSGFDRHAIVVFESDMQKFLQGLEGTLQFIEKTRKAKIKDSAEKTISRNKQSRSAEGAKVSSGRGDSADRADSRGGSPRAGTARAGTARPGAPRTGAARTGAPRRSTAEGAPGAANGLRADGKPRRVKVISKKKAD